MSEVEKFKPLNKRIVVRRFEAKEKTSGGIIIPDNAKDIPVAGKVLAVGDESPVKVGDTAIFTKYAGSVIAIEGEELLIIKEEDLLGVYKK
jgi:chaperonin GroES